MSNFNATTYTNTITYPNGSTVTITYNAAPVVTPPAPITFPTDANLVTIGTLSYPLTAIDPPTTDPTQPGGRGPDQLIIITDPNTVTRNQWGYEVQVINGITGTGAIHKTVPASGYLLSGNGKAADFLMKAVTKIGTPVVVTAAPVTPPVVVPPVASSGAYLSAYWMIYSNSPKVHATDLPAAAREIRPSFVFQNGILSGTSPFGQTAMATELQTLQKSGVKVCPAIGGGGNSLDISNPAMFLSRWIDASKVFGVVPDGINIDIESDFSNSQLITLLQIMRTTYGPKFRISWSPNGSYVDQYLALAVQHLDLVDEFGQQFYDTTISWNDIDNRINQAKDAGLPLDKYALGFMIGNDSSHESVANCVSWMIIAKAQYGINKAYWWELSRTGTTDAMNKVVSLYS